MRGWVSLHLVIAGDGVLVVAGGLVKVDQVLHAGLGLLDSRSPDHKVRLLEPPVDCQQSGDEVTVGWLDLFEIQVKMVG